MFVLQIYTSDTFICGGDGIMPAQKKMINMRLTEEDQKRLTEIINSYADFSLVPPRMSDVMREALRLLHKKEVQGLVKEVATKEEL
jgi:Arc/MetJ-type ribon-helix-helix transcriptional regulator